MRDATTVLLLTAAVLAGAATGFAQEKPAAPKKAEEGKRAATDDAVEQAFLKAYFAEKELKEFFRSFRIHRKLPENFSYRRHS